MSLSLSPNTEARLIAKAREEGLSVDALVERLIDQAATPSKLTGKGKALKLPKWNPGVTGSLHRREIYGDVC